MIRTVCRDDFYEDGKLFKLRHELFQFEIANFKYSSFIAEQLLQQSLIDDSFLRGSSDCYHQVLVSDDLYINHQIKTINDYCREYWWVYPPEREIMNDHIRLC